MNITGCHKKKKKPTTLGFFFRSRTNKGRDVELAGSPVDQVCSSATLAEPRVNEAASVDVSLSSASVVEQPSPWQDGKQRTSGFNQNEFVQRVAVPDQLQ